MCPGRQRCCTAQGMICRHMGVARREDRCKIKKSGAQYCCRSGHHEATRRRLGPKEGSKRPAAGEQGQVSRKRQRTQGCTLDKAGGKDSTHPVATPAPLSNARPMSN
uniref:Uncharacterized protein n=1 Tax=Eutreptiella gymnastica TaxID=73025 RepID=A0A7S1N200_9EUGL